MVETYLTTDIIVIIVLTVVLVLVGIAAFFIHFYWTKIGVAEIWNTAKWSSMRSSFYRTIRRFSRGSTDKFVSEQHLSNVSINSDDIDDLSFENKRSNPLVTSYITHPNSIPKKPVSIVSYNNSIQNNYATRIDQPVGSTRIQNMHAKNNKKNNNQYNDLASMIQKQRF